MGKYLSFYKEPQGYFKVRTNNTIFVKYRNALYYLQAHNTNLHNLTSDLNLLYSHIGRLRRYLNTGNAYSLNRAGLMIMEELDNFILNWKNNNLMYYQALLAVLDHSKQADSRYSINSQSSIRQVKNSK